ncbi:MAG: hypothetical protein WAV02_14770 [Stellaceae bacterium]
MLLLILACLLYVPLIGAIYESPEGDPAISSGESNYSLGWIQLWEMVFGIPLWLVLGGMLLSAGRSGRMPVWAQGLAAILYLGAGITVWAVTQVYIAADGGVLVIVPALLVPLIAGYAVAMRLPALERLPAGRASQIVFAAMGLLMVAAIPLGFLDRHNLQAHVAADAARLDARIAKEQAQADKERTERQARYHALTPDSPLVEYVHYVNSTDEGDPERAVALAGARLVKTRQNDAIQLLDQGRINWVPELWAFDLAATPALCATYDDALRRLAASDEVYDLMVAEQIEPQLPNIKFFVAGHCNLDASLTAAEARVSKVIAVNTGDDQKQWVDFLATLVALHRKS